MCGDTPPVELYTVQVSFENDGFAVYSWKYGVVAPYRLPLRNVFLISLLEY